MALRLVVDASVGVKLYLKEPLSDRAETLFAQLTADQPALLYVPDLFFIECTNILWKYVRRFAYPNANALQDIVDLQRLRLRSVSTAELITDALKLSLTYNVTAYDACYVALAVRLSAPLITADERLVNTLAPHRLPIHWLGAYLQP